MATNFSSRVIGKIASLSFVVPSSSAIKDCLPTVLNRFQLHRRNNKPISNKTIFAFLCFNLFGLGYPANAAVVFLGESRDVRANASVTVQTGSESSSSSRNSLGDFADFDQLIAADVTLESGSASSIAQQTSQISTSSISASGEVTADAELTAYDPMFYTSANGSANTGFSVTFELTSSQMFDLFGSVSSLLNPSGNTYGQAELSLSSQDGSVNISFRTPYSDAATTPFDLSGSLFPNIYTLSTNANVYADAYGMGTTSGSAEFSFNLQFTNAVPIPAAGLLFGFGLLGLVGVARRKTVA